MTKEEIGAELQKWLRDDPIYCYTLILFAKQEGVISEEEYIKAKEELDKIYERDKAVLENRGKYMTSVFKKIGMTKTRVLWNLIEQFPDRFIGNLEDGWMRPDHDKICKRLKLSSIDYYSILDDLISNKYLEKVLVNKKMYWKIGFEKIMYDWEEENKL